MPAGAGEVSWRSQPPRNNILAAKAPTPGDDAHQEQIDALPSPSESDADALTPANGVILFVDPLGKPTDVFALMMAARMHHQKSIRIAGVVCPTYNARARAPGKAAVKQPKMTMYELNSKMKRSALLARALLEFLGVDKVHYMTGAKAEVPTLPIESPLFKELQFHIDLPR